MTAYISTEHDARGWRWTIFRSTPQGADIALRGAARYPDAASCQLAGSNISLELRNAMVSQSDDGSWRWTCRGEEGELLLRSRSFPDAVQCGDDLSRARLISAHALVHADTTNETAPVI